jgi:16S rRNA (guanine527-N7)-methyltransferase
MSVAIEPLPPEGFRALLEQGIPDFGLSLSRETVERLAAFLAELDRWRRKVNLTGKLRPIELVSHTLESVLGEQFLPPSARVVDVGTGGGFPGVPIAIARPDLQVTWLEPREKRAAFLRHVARDVPVGNVTVLAGRLESLPHGSFDSGTSRAVRIDAETIGKAEFLRRGGVLLLWTTSPERLKSMLAPGGLELEEVLPIPGTSRRAIGVFRRP